ncbi:MAG: GNAT family N-acetyltransferase [Candidatus Thermoplasmatota archaeon]|nr:GNAT family N-acetyltransferase [Euryarchaeota archaeon]MBU4032882.1 GNAT family N-acetyltransferase [Candidatus Thermoplasmatota archaeon]MBU4071763.1 GNAT family N-acetyltransferase [Candidatus Thermoplasmatota archaeon]MBU4144882.1 GNAT family N-acetyltransferase [Candidatus Thermoplasmatota archaeon]MBU4592849.1 GNAT family N-acetyltransferase [Candidatus Thermoplasmatota archaeon]
MGIEIRAMEEQDIPETIRVMKEAWVHSYESIEERYYPREAHDFDMSLNTVERYTGSMEYEYGFFFIAEVDGKIAGSIRGEIIGKSGFGMIRNIAVHPNYLRKGTGRALMEHAVDYLKAEGCHKVSLNTMPVLLPAINLYLKMGFVPEAYLAKQWWGVDFIYMSLWFDKIG